MIKRRRTILIGLGALAWLAFLALDIVNGWHGYYVAIGAVIWLYLQSVLFPWNWGALQGGQPPQGPWPDQAALPELVRRLRRKRAGLNGK